MYRKSSRYDGHFCLVHSHFLPSIEKPGGKVRPSPREPLTRPFTINLMLTFLMDVGDGRGETNCGCAISGSESVHKRKAAVWFVKKYSWTLLLQDIERFMQYLTLINHETGNMTIQPKTVYTIIIIFLKDLSTSHLWVPPYYGLGMVMVSCCRGHF